MGKTRVYASGEILVSLGRLSATSTDGATGDRQGTGIEGLMSRHGPGVLRVIRRTLGPKDPDVEDCFQDSFVEFARTRGWAEHPNPGALLCRIATTNAIDRIRRRQSERRFKLRLADAPREAAPDASVPAAAAELLAAIHAILAEIPELQAQAFVMAQLEETPHAEIAQILGVEVNHVGVLVHRARSALKARLADARKGVTS